MSAVTPEIELILDVAVGLPFLAVFDEVRLAAGFDFGLIGQSLAVGAERGVAHLRISLLILAIHHDELAFAQSGRRGDCCSSGTENQLLQLVVTCSFMAIDDDQQFIALNGLVGYAFAIGAEDQSAD